MVQIAKKKILMVNLPYTGHTNPTLPLARELVSRGHEVAYINSPEWKERIEATGSSFIPYKDWPANLSHDEEKKRCVWAAYERTKEVGGDNDLLIHEALFYPAKTLAEQLGLPRVRQWSFCAWNEPVFQLQQASSSLFAFFSWLLEKDMYPRRVTRRMQLESGSIIKKIVQDGADLEIVYVPELFQPKRETFSDNYHFVNMHYPLGSGGESFPFATSDRPLIYISLGSILSSKAFCLKCIRAFRNEDVNVILVTGKVDVASLGEIPDNFHLTSYAPQIEILQRAALFITHGGMNSINEAMFYGVPMLVLPLLNDQPGNALRIEELGLGKKMSPFFAGHEALKDNALALITAEAVSTRCKEIAALLQKASNFLQTVDKVEILAAEGRG